jgi:hypothetical protein
VATAEALAVYEAGRLAQGALAAQVARDYVTLFPLLTKRGGVSSNAPFWLQTLVRLITQRRQVAAATAAQYLSAYRFAELGATTDGFSVLPVLDVPTEAITTSLMVLGPTAYRREVARQLGKHTSDLTDGDLDGARLPGGIEAKLAANGARAAMRHVRNGARDTLDRVIQEDPRTIGYFRTTSTHPCFFCAMLASRGPVYDKDSFDESDPRFHGPGNAKVHDGCGCDLRPLYTTAGADELTRVREFEALWKRTGNLQAFREAYEGRS